MSTLDYWVCTKTRRLHRFYIRSKSDPTVFWHDNDGFIVASKTERTKFRVTGKTRLEKDHVMIRSDLISITVIGKDNGYIRNDDGILVTGGSGNDTFLFSEFTTAFLPSGVSGDAVMSGSLLLSYFLILRPD
ncbi:hypothetical protein BDV35DRAFT_392953 [Aspergillus flavus]|uniref:Uncharacterized protein n=1 Tax=Aspergillus flavus TaxID=5059 RepID=A0A5N6GW06_ASPFL|nr:hypothetical protein BDV35DRAFT_392953 [Aspergillus flavus]